MSSENKKYFQLLESVEIKSEDIPHFPQEDWDIKASRKRARRVRIPNFYENYTQYEMNETVEGKPFWMKSYKLNKYNLTCAEWDEQKFRIQNHIYECDLQGDDARYWFLKWSTQEEANRLDRWTHLEKCTDCNNPSIWFCSSSN